MTKLEINQAIQNELTTNNNADRKALAIKYNVGIMTISANVSILVRRGVLPKAEKITKVINTLDNVMNKAVEKLSKKERIRLKNGTIEITQPIIVLSEIEKRREYQRNWLRNKTAKLKGTLIPIEKKAIKVKNTYNNHDGINKELARGVMVDTIVATNVEGDVLTLPNTEWAIEGRIQAERKNTYFIGVERDEPTFNKMVINRKKIGINGKSYFGNIGDKIYGTLANTFAHLILDYCGMLPTFAKELEYAIHNDIVKIGGIIAMTFAKPIRGTGGMFDSISALGKVKTNLVEDGRCMSDKATEAYFNKVTGFNYELVEIFNYQDEYPMTLVIVKRIK